MSLKFLSDFLLTTRPPPVSRFLFPDFLTSRSLMGRQYENLVRKRPYSTRREASGVSFSRKARALSPTKEFFCPFPFFPLPAPRFLIPVSFFLLPAPSSPVDVWAKYCYYHFIYGFQRKDKLVETLDFQAQARIALAGSGYRL